MFCASTPEDSLAFILADQGYDVWLGNTRGSKYSSKHSKFDLNSAQGRSQYWDFSLDQYVKYDVPDVVDYILERTGAKKVSYIGFSQGSAQALAALALNDDLNTKINRLFALAPPMKPKRI